MARGVNLKGKPKQKVARKTKSEQYLVNFKYLGDEPDSDFKSISDQIRAFNWYNSMCEMDEARGYLKDYLTITNRTDLSEKLDKVPDSFFPTTAAWMARIAQRKKSSIEPHEYDRFMGLIEVSISHIKEEKVDVKKVDKPNIQDRIRDRAQDIIGDVEELIDKGDEFSLYDWLKRNEIPAMYATKIGDYYGAVWKEMVDAQAGRIEGYENWTKAQLKARVAFYNQLVEDAERYGDNTKKTRPPRKKKAPTAEKLLKNFKYQKDSNEHKIASVNPESIIGAKTLWTFNTKYNTLSVYNAMGPAGLSVRGTTIANFDESSSKALQIGRKTQERLETVLKGGKIVVKRLIDEMKNDTNGRINENTILLKVIK